MAKIDLGAARAEVPGRVTANSAFKVQHKPMTCAHQVMHSIKSRPTSLMLRGHTSFSLLTTVAARRARHVATTATVVSGAVAAPATAVGADSVAAVLVAIRAQQAVLARVHQEVTMLAAETRIDAMLTARDQTETAVPPNLTR